MVTNVYTRYTIVITANHMTVGYTHLFDSIKRPISGIRISPNNFSLDFTVDCD